MVVVSGVVVEMKDMSHVALSSSKVAVSGEYDGGARNRQACSSRLVYCLTPCT